MRMHFVLSAVILLASAGCVSPSEVAPAGEVSAAQPEEERERAAAPPAEDPTPSYAPPPAEATGPGSAAPVERALELAWEGTTRGFLCVRTPAPYCGTALPGEGTERYVPEFDGAPARLHVVLTWEASSPLAEELVLHVEGVADCDHDCHARGTSPLEIALDALPLAEDWDLTIHAFVPCQVCDGHEHMMDPGQRFHLSGTLVYLPYE